MKEIEQHVENDQYTLKDMKEHIEKNHIITNISLFHTYIFVGVYYIAKRGIKLVWVTHISIAK